MELRKNKDLGYVVFLWLTYSAYQYFCQPQNYPVSNVMLANARYVNLKGNWRILNLKR